MKHPSTMVSALVFTAIFAGISGTAALAYPGDERTTGMLDLNSTDTASAMDWDAWAMKDHNGTFGMITGITNDADGNPAWLLGGHWQISYASNSSAIGGTTSGNVSDFNAMFHMVMLNGSAMHSHELSNFTQTEEATFNTTANSTTYVGTSTITMREGPVNDVGTRITISDLVLRMELDPTMIDNHFGNSPIYGLAVTEEMIAEHKGMMSGTMIQETSNMTGTMHDSWPDNSTGTSGMMDEIWK